jgi:hypothetical protein
LASIWGISFLLRVYLFAAGFFSVQFMDSSEDELQSEIEMLPTRSILPRPNNHTQSMRFGRRCAARYGIQLLLSTAGIFIAGYLFWPGTLSRPSMNPSVDIRLPSHNSVWSKHTASVKEAFLHAYEGYERHTTFPDDELRPVSNSGRRK